MLAPCPIMSKVHKPDCYLFSGIFCELFMEFTTNTKDLTNVFFLLVVLICKLKLLQGRLNNAIFIQ